MSRGLDMLGASGEGLKAYNIVLHVDKIDKAILEKKLADMKVSGAFAPAIMLATDRVPKFVIDSALPMAEKELLKYGVTASVTAVDIPSVKGSWKNSEFIPGAICGIIVAALATGITWTLLKTSKVVFG